MPSHRNINQQRFHSTKRKRKLTSGRLSKLTEKQKVSIIEAINHTSRSSQVVNNEYDHIYYNHNIFYLGNMTVVFVTLLNIYILQYVFK